MLFSVEQAYVGRDERRAPLKTPAWEARLTGDFLTSEIAEDDWEHNININFIYTRSLE